MPNELQAAPANPLATLLADTDKLKELPIDTVERLFEMDRRMRADGAREAFHEAFAEVQGELQPVVKRAKNAQTGSVYALAEDVERMANPILTRHGFSRSISQSETCPQPDHYRIILTLRRAGHQEQHYMDAPNDSTGPKGNPTKTKLHGMASSHTFVGRHLLCNVLGVILTMSDDDGNAGAGIGPGAGCISVDQAIVLKDLIDETGANQSLFLKACKVAKLEDLPLSMYAGAKARLEMKRATS